VITQLGVTIWRSTLDQLGGPANTRRINPSQRGPRAACMSAASAHQWRRFMEMIEESKGVVSHKRRKMTGK